MIEALSWFGIVLAALFSITIGAIGVGTCPPQWHHNGVRRYTDRGAFECEAKLPPCCGEPAGALECQRQCPAVQRFHSRIYCTGGTLPIVVNERTIGCQR